MPTASARETAFVLPSAASILAPVATVAIGIVAGVIALIVHKQRLMHERELSDRAELRQVLDAGAALLAEVQASAQAMCNVPVAQREAMSVTRELRAYHPRLMLWVPRSDDLAMTWLRISDIYRR